MKKSILGLIPVRLNSKRIHQKPLLTLRGLPLFAHAYRRSKLSTLLDDLYLCCDSLKILNLAKKLNIKCMLTSKKHKNGTERINEAYQKLKKNYDFIVDIQGDEALIDPRHIDRVIKFHLKNSSYDIILPTIKIKNKKKISLVKVVKNSKNEVLYLSRLDVPMNYSNKNKNNYLDKHLSIISFRSNALKLFSQTKPTYLEKIENIELLRAIDIGLKIKSFNLTGETLSVDIKKDYFEAKKKIKTDKLCKKYLNEN